MGEAPIPSWMESLSEREIEILGLVSEGLSNREVAERLCLSVNTVKWYNRQLFSKLGVRSRTQALKVARQYHLIPVEAVRKDDEKRFPRSNLPVQWTSYVGRSVEFAELQALLGQSRLVVLTGPGGTGKTRLALEVAQAVSSGYRHGVWLVQLAPLRDPTHVADAIARVLKVRAGSGTPLVQAIKNSLAGRSLLLVLDNFEHVLAAAPLVTELLASAPGLSVLVTSRERLHLYGEVEYPVKPLALPNLRTNPTAEEIVACEAVDLFLQRARAAQPHLETDDEHVAAAGRICVRLDGLPLAIELAASHAKVYPLPRLAELLEQSLGVLPDGPRDVPARQRTLRATIEWSTDPLHVGEKRLLSRLAVFDGGSTLEAIRCICAPGLDGDVIDFLLSLVDKSLVVVHEGAEGEPRFAMLETIHEFAADLLDSSGEEDAIRMRHAAYFAGLAELFSREVRSARQEAWNARLQVERGNLNSALAWSLRGTEYATGLRLAAALMDHWYYHGTMEDARWAELALEKAGSSLPALRAAVSKAVGTLYHNLGDMARVAVLHRQAADLFSRVGDERNAAWSMMFVAIANSEHPEQIESCLTTTRESLATLRRLGDKPGMATALSALGELWRMKGEYETAGSCYAESLALSVETGERIRQAVQYVNLGFVEYHKGEHAQAIDHIRQSLVIMDELEIIPGILTGLYLLAGPVAALGAPSDAARLLGAADREQELTDARLRPSDRRDILPIVDSVRHMLGGQDFERVWVEGAGMTRRQAMALALGASP